MSFNQTSGVYQHFITFQKILNYLLFSQLEPIPVNEDGHYPLSGRITNSYGIEGQDTKCEIVFYEQSLGFLLKKELEDSDLLQILESYRSSFYRGIIYDVIKLQSKSYSFSLQNAPTDLTETEIVAVLLGRRFLPIHIFTYLVNIFTITAEYIGKKEISSEDYSYLAAYTRSSFDIENIISKAKNEIFRKDRSLDNFFTDEDKYDYRQWIKFEISKQQRGNINEQ